MVLVIIITGMGNTFIRRFNFVTRKSSSVPKPNPINKPTIKALWSINPWFNLWYIIPANNEKKQNKDSSLNFLTSNGCISF